MPVAVASDFDSILDFTTHAAANAMLAAPSAKIDVFAMSLLVWPCGLPEEEEPTTATNAPHATASTDGQKGGTRDEGIFFSAGFQPFRLATSRVTKRKRM